MLKVDVNEGYFEAKGKGMELLEDWAYAAVQLMKMFLKNGMPENDAKLLFKQILKAARKTAIEAVELGEE